MEKFETEKHKYFAPVEVEIDISNAIAVEGNDFPDFQMLYLPTLGRHGHIRRSTLAYAICGPAWDDMCAAIADECRYRAILACEICHWLDMAIQHGRCPAAIAKLQDTRDTHLAKVHGAA